MQAGCRSGLSAACTTPLDDVYNKQPPFSSPLKYKTLFDSTLPSLTIFGPWLSISTDTSASIRSRSSPHYDEYRDPATAGRSSSYNRVYPRTPRLSRAFYPSDTHSSRTVVRRFPPVPTATRFDCEHLPLSIVRLGP